MMSYCIILGFLQLGCVLGLPQQSTTIPTPTISYPPYDPEVQFTACWLVQSSFFGQESCNNCFEKAWSSQGEKSLSEFKHCVGKYLPGHNEACADEIGNMTSLTETEILPTLACFKFGNDYLARYGCLQRSNSTDAVEKVTAGVECTMRVQQRYTEALILEKPEKAGLEHLNNVQTVVELVPMLSMASCDGPSSNACQKCFLKVVTSKQVADMVSCSQRFLPQFQDCQPGLESLAQEANSTLEEKVVTCYRTKLIRQAVRKCLEPGVEVDAFNFRKILICAMAGTLDWNNNFTGGQIYDTAVKCIDDYGKGFLAGVYTVVQCGIWNTWQWIGTILADV